MEAIIETDTSRLISCDHRSQKLIEECIVEIQDMLLSKPPIVIFGKQCRQQRDVGFFSNESLGYRYSNQVMEAQPVTPKLQRLLNRICGLTGMYFNSILINRYEDGSNYISAHSDDEKGLTHSTVACVCKGERIFRIRNKLTKEIECDIPTLDDKMLIMDGDFQKNYTHEIPVSKIFCQPRYSFTFRCHSE